MATLRPQEVDLLIAITKQIKGTFDFTEAAQQLGITTSAASQRWGRLKTKIISKQEISLKNSDEYTLLVSIAKQFGAGFVDFDAIGAQIGCSSGAATQRWGRLRQKIVGGKQKTAISMADTLSSPDFKVVKPPPKPKSTTPKTKSLKPYPMPKPKKEKVSKKTKAKATTTEPKEEDNLDDLAEAQLQEKCASAVEQGFEPDEAMEEYADAQVEEAALVRAATFSYLDNDDEWVERFLEADEKLEQATDQDLDIRYHSDDDEV
ncbi:hypothetical protein BDZ45DRAFT_683875 [Acephala macrosclerotiorum]|nr:hypothetical protein BDZ45DRAFT_683875 [Acephala macrosclerotiorum]